MWGYVALYVLFATGVYGVDRLTHRSLFVKTQSRHFRWKLNISLRNWGVDEYLAAVISICSVVLQLMLILHGLGSDIDKALSRWLFGVLSLSSIVLVVRLLGLVERFARHKGWLTVLAALLTIAFGLISSAKADAFILGHTQVEPGQFPVAQKTLTFIYLVYYWYFCTSMLLPVVMFAGALVFGMIAPGFMQKMKRNRATAICWKHYIPSVSWRKHQWIQASCVIGVIYTALILFAFSEVVNAKLRTALHEAMVYASFHLGPHDCALAKEPESTRLALLAKGGVVIARPVEGGYRYTEQACTLQSVAQIEAAREQHIRDAKARDAYF